MTSNSDQPTLGAASALVIVLALATAAIHFSLVADEFDKGATGYGTLFILTGLGYLAALALRYLPFSVLAPFRSAGSMLMVGIAIAAIITYVSLGYFDTLGWVTKGIESALVLAVGAEMLSTGRSTGRVRDSVPRSASQS